MLGPVWRVRDAERALSLELRAVGAGGAVRERVRRREALHAPVVAVALVAEVRRAEAEEDGERAAVATFEGDGVLAVRRARGARDAARAAAAHEVGGVEGDDAVVVAARKVALAGADAAEEGPRALGALVDCSGSGGRAEGEGERVRESEMFCASMSTTTQSLSYS